MKLNQPKKLIKNWIKKTAETSLRNNAGWTFMETLIVISIILVLTSTVGFMSIGYIDKARVAAAKVQEENLSLALDTYFMDTFTYPSFEQGLKALWEKPVLEPLPKNWDGPYLKKKLTLDPWGNKYEYNIPGPKGLPYSITSLGKDGLPGGSGVNSDISTWEN